MISCHTVGSRVYLLIYSRRFNRNRTRQFFPWHRPPWHLLCSSPFSLCSIYRSSLCYYRWFYSLIPSILRLYNKHNLSKNSLPNYIRGSKYNFLPTTLLGTVRYTTTLLRLSRRLHYLKYCVFYRLIHLTNRCYLNNFYSVRSIRIQTRSVSSRTTIYKSWMTSRMSSPLSHLWGTYLCKS